MFAALPGRSLPGRIRDRVRRRLRGEDGFFLLETVIAISLITVIMTAVGVEFLTGLSSTTQQRARSAAVQLADSSVEGLRALHSSDLVKGRDNSSVTVEYNTLAAIPAVAPWLNSDSAHFAYDSSVNSGGATAAVPTAPVTQKPGPISYQVYEYLECVLVSTKGSCASTSAVPNNSIRAIVAVIWTQNGCPANTCSYVTSTIINADADPTFDLNQALPAAPVVADPGAQTFAVNDLVSLQLNVQNGKGVAPFTWALTGGALPNGLTLSPAGLIGGTVQAPAGSPSYPLSYSSVITVTDAFLRQASITINWTVLAPLAFNPVANQVSTTTTSVNLTVSATGGTGSGYTYSDPGNTLPPGLTLSSGGVITGTPTPPAPRVYTVQLTVTDGSGKRTATTSFSWQVTYPPIGISSPPAQSSTVGTADTLQMNASGGDGNYAWSATGLPAGLSIDPSSGLISGTPTATQSTTVTVTVTDNSAQVPSKQTTFSWTVYKAPTIGAQSAQQSTQGGPGSYQIVNASCPDGGCTYSISGQPNGLAVNPSSGLISGTVAANAVSSTVKVTVTDAAGAQASTTFAWTIYNPPSLAGLGVHTDSEGAVDNVPITYTCPNTSCAINLSGAVPGVGLETTAGKAGNNSADTSLTVSATSGTVYLTGTVQSTAVSGTATSKAYTVRLTITDGGNVTPPASTATWTAYPPAPTITGLTNVSQSAGKAVTQKLTYTCQVASCTISFSGAPSGIGLDTNTTGSVKSTLTGLGTTNGGTAYLRGTIANGNATGGYPITVTISDGNNLVGTVTATWTVQ